MHFWHLKEESGLKQADFPPAAGGKGRQPCSCLAPLEPLKLLLARLFRVWFRHRWMQGEIVRVRCPP